VDSSVYGGGRVLAVLITLSTEFVLVKNLMELWLTLVRGLILWYTGLGGRGFRRGVFVEVFYEHGVVCGNAETRDFGKIVHIGHRREVRRWLNGRIGGGKRKIGWEMCVMHVRGNG
jgi:hypothetical protein